MEENKGVSFVVLGVVAVVAVVALILLLQSAKTAKVVDDVTGMPIVAQRGGGGGGMRAFAQQAGTVGAGGPCPQPTCPTQFGTCNAFLFGQRCPPPLSNRGQLMYPPNFPSTCPRNPGICCCAR